MELENQLAWLSAYTSSPHPTKLAASRLIGLLSLSSPVCGVGIILASIT